MKVEGGCFCGALRYAAEGEPVMKGQCHCRQCQHFAGGGPNVFLAMPISGFAYTQGAARTYRRADAPVLPASREFYEICGVQVATRSEALPEVIFIKVGTLDDPALFGGPDIAIFTCDQQPFHQIAAGVTAFEKLPPLEKRPTA